MYENYIRLRILFHMYSYCKTYTYIIVYGTYIRISNLILPIMGAILVFIYMYVNFHRFLRACIEYGSNDLNVILYVPRQILTYFFNSPIYCCIFHENEILTTNYFY